MWQNQNWKTITLEINSQNLDKNWRGTVVFHLKFWKRGQGIFEWGVYYIPGKTKHPNRKPEKAVQIANPNIQFSQPGTRLWTRPATSPTPIWPAPIIKKPERRNLKNSTKTCYSTTHHGRTIKSRGRVKTEKSAEMPAGLNAVTNAASGRMTCSNTINRECLCQQTFSPWPDPTDTLAHRRKRTNKFHHSNIFKNRILTLDVLKIYEKKYFLIVANRHLKNERILQWL